MVPIFIPLPSSPDEWHDIAAKFENRWNYSYGLEAIDGKHVIIKKPAKCGSYYYNYKKTQSFSWRSLGQIMSAYGQMLDVMVEIMMAGYGISLDYTKVSKMEGLSSLRMIRYWKIIAIYLMFSLVMMQSDLTIDKRIYNYRHSRARRISEKLFGILANRYRIFSTMIPLSPRCVENILSTLALHKMLWKSTSSRNLYRPATSVDSFDDHGNLVEGDWQNKETSDLFYPLKGPTHWTQFYNSTREFQDCFMNEGAVSWQWGHC